MAAGSGMLRKARICALSSVFLILGACAKPPEREVGEAQRNLDEARARGAEMYAPELYLKAESSLQEAKNLISEKDYKRGRKAAEAVSILALQSSVLAETTKAGMKEEAQRTVREAEQGLANLRDWNPPASMRKGLEDLQEGNEVRLQAWEHNLGLAKATLSEEKTREAHLLAERVLRDVSARMEELETIVTESRDRK